ncbi:unnamed protein product [Auanema sp. JU1783]|nr:unnamed protein product [Auanema sp. JU1783]
MAVLSRLAAWWNIPTLTTNCYETVHTWHPDCHKAILVAMPDGLKFSLKTYIPFYLIGALLALRKSKKFDFKRYARDVVQSSAFLMVNLCLYLWFICRLRHLFGMFTPFTLGGLSSILASFIAIFVEKPTRRPGLALYLLNLASETFYRHLCIQGSAVAIKYGQCIPFAAGLAIFMVLFSKNMLSKPMLDFFKLTHGINKKSENLEKLPVPISFKAFLTNLRKEGSKTEHCEHENSCASNIMENFVRNYVLGYGLSTALTVIGGFPKLITNPQAIIRKMFSLRFQKLPAFLALLPLLFHSVRCSMNRLNIGNRTIKNVSAGMVSSLAMIIYPNNTVAMYTFWKAVEIVYYELVSRGWAPNIKYGDIILYSLSTGYVLWMSTIQPHSIRASYLHFLHGLTGQRLRLFNRTLISHFGYRSQEAYNYVPKLLTQYTTLNPAIYQPTLPCLSE